MQPPHTDLIVSVEPHLVSDRVELVRSPHDLDATSTVWQKSTIWPFIASSGSSWCYFAQTRNKLEWCLPYYTWPCFQILHVWYIETWWHWSDLKKSRKKSCSEGLFALLFEKENLTVTSRNYVNYVVMTLGMCSEKWKCAWSINENLVKRQIKLLLPDISCEVKGCFSF